ncbi:MAG TPA: prephenate dehydrogenase/arogenate dehydrogenase family protein [Anaerolineales bacterium]|nr:prephenate dehydrogenase/arogenate dehydrogenase family protein [Anaerolineales bacterium]
MEDGFRLQNAKVAIVGLGLMGGSLALALKGKCAALYGIDSQPATLELALAQKIVHQADSDPAKLLPQADLVILATPVPIIIDFIEKLPALTQSPCIVLDLGSTKRDIVQAMAALPERFDPVGGHPICGKEKSGLENADANLYRESIFVVTALERTTGRAKSAMQEIISAIGAHAAEIAAEDHDRVLAATSHLPCVLSTALALCTPQEFVSFVGTGFKSTSRLAGTPASMAMGIYKSNRDNILNAVQSFRSSLNRIEAALQHEDYPELELLLNQSRAVYQSLTDSRPLTTDH